MIGIRDLSKPTTIDLNSTQKFIPSTLCNNISRPNSINELDEAMKKMDSQNGTSFYNWIKSEENIGYICTYKRDIFEENFENNPKQVFIAVKWLVSGWSVPSVSEFLLKMFYHWKLESKKFGALVNCICNGFQTKDNSSTLLETPEFNKRFEKKKVLDLLHVLLIGENAKSTSKFLLNFTKSFNIVKGFGKDNFEDNKVEQKDSYPAADYKTKSWDRFEILEVVKGLSFRLQWDEAFLKQLLIEFVQNSPLKNTEKKQLDLIQLIKFKFHQESTSPINSLDVSPPFSNLTDTDESNEIKLQNNAEQYIIKNNAFKFTYRYKINFFIQLFDTILIELECMELSLILEDLQILKNNFLNNKNFNELGSDECSEDELIDQDELLLKGLIKNKELRLRSFSSQGSCTTNRIDSRLSFQDLEE